MQKIDIIGIIEEYQKYKIRGNELITRCIVAGCPDRKGHLYIDLSSGLWICFRCGEKGNQEKFLKLWNKKFSTKHKIVNLNKIIKLSKNSDKIIDTPLPSDFKLLKDIQGDTTAKRYLRRRGITEKQWKIYELGVSNSIENSIIIPVKENGKIRTFISKNYVSGRYKSNKGIKNFLFGNDFAMKFNTIIIVEGVFDAIHIGYNAVALFGKSISDTQVRKLLRFPAKKVIIALDGDTKLVERYNIAKRLAISKEVWIYDLPQGTDPDEIDWRDYDKYIRPFL